MTGRIPQQFIDELMSRIDIVALVDARVPLRKTGQNYSARCPFHEEKSPSFTVSPTKQFYHCFGCGAHGTAIGFLMAYEHLNFVEAVQELAHQAGLDLPQSETGTPATAAPNAPLYDVLERAYWKRGWSRKRNRAVTTIGSAIALCFRSAIAAAVSLVSAVAFWIKTARRNTSILRKHRSFTKVGSSTASLRRSWPCADSTDCWWWKATWTWWPWHNMTSVMPSPPSVPPPPRNALSASSAPRPRSASASTATAPAERPPIAHWSTPSRRSARAARPASCSCPKAKTRIPWCAGKARPSSNSGLRSPSHFPRFFMKGLSSEPT